MNLWQTLLDIFFPPKCAFCGCLLSLPGSGVCPVCRKGLPFVQTGTPRRIEFVPAVLSPFYYKEPVREALLRYKFRNHPAISETFANFMSEEVEKSPDIMYDTISWVPLSRQRERRRGYDQARLLAEAIARRQGVPCMRLLRKIRHAAPQSGLRSAAERKANIFGCYAAVPSVSPEGKRILLIDDVITTGSTLSECARVLKMHGAAEVYALTAATRPLDAPSENLP